MRKFKVVIIEDDFEITNHLIDKINSSNSYEVIKTFINPVLFLNEEIFEFDLILLDVVMPELNGLDAIKPILNRYSDALIVMNTIMDDSETIFTALKYGVVGYIDKQFFDKNYIEIFDIVIHGGAYMTPKIARKVVNNFKQHNLRLERLTNRENEIANSIIEGLSYKLIANKYNISIDTVRIHIKSIYRKLKINSKGELFNMINTNS